MQSFKSIPILVLEIWGKKGSKLGDFGHFSKDMVMIWFVLLEMEDIMILHMRAMFQVHSKKFSRDMGQKGVTIGVFTEFLHDYLNDLVRSLSETR